MIVGSIYIYIMYADDLVILAPSHVGLSMLLSVCSDYALEHDIKFISAKSNIYYYDILL